MTTLTLWGIAWWHWVIAALFLAALGQRERIQKVTFIPATILGLLGGWTFGWAVGDCFYRAALAESSSATPWGGMYWCIGGAAFALVFGSGSLYLAMPVWRRKAAKATAVVTKPTTPTAPTPPPPAAPEQPAAQ